MNPKERLLTALGFPDGTVDVSDEQLAEAAEKLKAENDELWGCYIYEYGHTYCSPKKRTALNRDLCFMDSKMVDAVSAMPRVKSMPNITIDDKPEFKYRLELPERESEKNKP